MVPLKFFDPLCITFHPILLILFAATLKSYHAMVSWRRLRGLVAQSFQFCTPCESACEFARAGGWVAACTRGGCVPMIIVICRMVRERRGAGGLVGFIVEPAYNFGDVICRGLTCSVVAAGYNMEVMRLYACFFVGYIEISWTTQY